MRVQAQGAALTISGLAAFFAPGVPAAALADGAFVRVRGTEFVLGSESRPVRFVGANIDPLHGEINRPRAAQIIRALPKDGLTVARVWALGEGPPDADGWMRKFELFRAGPSGFIEDSFVLLDRVLAEARQAGVRVILTLSNHWKDYGGVPMYLRWAGLPDSGLAQEEFYRNEKTRAMYREHLQRLLTRRNSLTGVAYVDDPTIFSWELMNESQVLTPAGQAARTAWIREMASFIKERDKNHLIAAGLLGYSQHKEREEWIRVHKLPDIDYCDSHLYMQNTEGGASLRRMQQLLDDRAQLATHVIKKPLVIGEFGFLTNGPKNFLGLARASWVDELLLRHFRNGGAGALAWIYQPYHGKPRDYGIYIDRPDTDDMRRILRSYAARLARGAEFPKNPRLGPSVGESPLYQRMQTLYGRPQAGVTWQRLPKSPASPASAREYELRVPPGSFSIAHFERGGYWDGPQVSHAYGGDVGEFNYRFTSPGGKAGPLPRPTAFHIEARVSSEWPGATAPPDGGSLLVIKLDGQEVARREVVPDDGLGRREHFEVTDRALLARLQSGTHTLTFEIPSGPRSSGLCIYGDARSEEPPPAGEFSPILLRYQLKDPSKTGAQLLQRRRTQLATRPRNSIQN